MSKREAKKITEKLKKYKPKAVILFGSYAWGKPNKNSDFDLLIIKNTKKNPHQRIPEVRKYLFDFDKPLDILVLTPDEIKKRMEKKDFFITEIITKGKVLYEATE